MASLLARFNEYRANPDPRARAANTLALLLASNAPTYPIYLYFLVGWAAWPSLIPLVGAPVFAAVPAAMRRSRLGGTVLLVAVSTVNTALYALLFGAAADLQLFFLPCISLGLFFHHRERWLAWALAGLPLVLFILLRGHEHGIRPYDAAQYARMRTLSEWSVATLTWFMMVTFGGMMRAQR